MADLEDRYGSHRHCPTGSAVVSDAGEPAGTHRDPCRGAGLERRRAVRRTLLLADAHRNALDLARRMVPDGRPSRRSRPGSTAILSTAAASVAIGTVGAWLDEHPDAVDLVTFVLFSGDALAAFDQALARA